MEEVNTGLDKRKEKRREIDFFSIYLLGKLRKDSACARMQGLYVHNYWVQRVLFTEYLLNLLLNPT